MQVLERFVGRRAELDELHAAVDATLKGRGSVVLLTGEPGIGKTRLAEQGAEYAREKGCAVRWGSCWEGPAAPFWPWTQLVRAQLEASSSTAESADIARLAGAAADAAEGDAAEDDAEDDGK